MKTKIYPSQVSGELRIVSSKSFIHRALICAALSDDKSLIKNIDLNDDIIRTMDALVEMGAEIKVKENDIIVNPIQKRDQSSLVLNAHESGSTIRFLIPLGAHFYEDLLFCGSPQLLSRPQDVYKELFESEGHSFEVKDGGIHIKGSLKNHEFKLRGDISSQFISGLLFMMPLLEHDSKITLTSELQSKPYVDLTLDIMNRFKIELNDDLSVQGNQKYQAQDIESEGDFSQAAFFAVLAAINHDLTLTNLNVKSKQGDKAIFETLKSLGVAMDDTPEGIKVYQSSLSSGHFDIKDTPDLAPILFVLGLFSEESLRLDHIQRLKIKESNRLEAMIMELKKFGAQIDVLEDAVIIHRLEKFKKVDEVSSHNDHRIAMALSILATKLDYPLSILNSEAINKSYPKFFEDLEKLGVKLENCDI